MAIRNIVPRLNKQEQIGTEIKAFAESNFHKVRCIDGVGNNVQLPTLTQTEVNSLAKLNGMMWYNGTTNTFQRYENNTVKNLGIGGGGSAGSIFTQPPSSPISMAQNDVVTVTHPSITNEQIDFSVLEETSNVTGLLNVLHSFNAINEIDYFQEDSINGTDFVDNKISLHSTNLNLTNSNSLIFNGTTSKIVVDNTNNVFDQVFNTVTIEAYIKPNVNAGTLTIISKDVVGSRGFACVLLPTNKLQFTINGFNVESTSTITDSVWTHVVFQFSANTFMKIFINQALDKNETVGIPANLPISTADLIIGNSDNVNFNAFDGNLNALRFWSDIRTDVEIVDNALLTLEGNENNLLGLWNFQEGAGTNVANTTGNENTGIVTDGVWDTSVPFAGGRLADYVLLQHFDVDTQFADELGHTVNTFGVAQISTNATKIQYGDGALQVDNGDVSRLEIVDPTNDYQFGSNDFSIDFWINYPVGTSTGDVITTRTDGTVGGFVINAPGNGVFEFFASSDGVSWDIASGLQITGVFVQTLNHIEVSRKGNNWYFFFNGLLFTTFNSSLAIHNTGNALRIGGSTILGNNIIAFFDELRILNGRAGHTGDFDVRTTEYATKSYPISQAYHVITQDSIQINTANFLTIENVNTTEITPVSTSIKYLVSFDGRVTWKYFNGSTWTVTTLANLQSVGMSKTQLNAISEAQWSATGGFIAGTTLTLDFAIDLKTTLAITTPTLDQITVTYSRAGEYELQDLRNQDDVGGDYTVERLTATTSKFKKLTATTRNVFLNVIT